MNQPEDIPEIHDLERTAERRMRQVDADPADQVSATAAQQLLALAADLRQPRASALRAELCAIGNWLDESGGTGDFLDLAEAYRLTIGVTHHPRDGEAYLRALIDLARRAAEGR